ncbi:MAG: AtpZ/AtpI family protein [Lachnospiraceae bacterium]|nr:AtpZ/AtpI family protein [Lachnospiraceae bacterium]
MKNGTLKNLVLITEVGLLVIIPVVLCVLLGIYFRNRFGVVWPLVALIFLGLASGLLSAWKLLKKAAPKPSDDEKTETYDLMREWHKDGNEK